VANWLAVLSRMKEAEVLDPGPELVLSPSGVPTNEEVNRVANVVSMKALLEAGVHFGHHTRRWDPRMKPFIFTERNGIHIIDLQQTVVKLGEAYSFVRELVTNGGTILFVGTKKQAQEAVEQEAKRCGMYYVNQRWLGGMLTNFRTIQARIRWLDDLERQKEAGDFERLPKKEATRLEEEIGRLTRLLAGIREMKRLPDAVFIIDPHKERIAIAEARRLEIPIIALVDTNCNPDEIDYVIPANDDAIRAVKLLSGKIADAAIEGADIRQSLQAEKEGLAEKEVAEQAQEEAAKRVEEKPAEQVPAVEEGQEVAPEAGQPESTEPEAVAATEPVVPGEEVGQESVENGTSAQPEPGEAHEEREEAEPVS